MIVDSHLFRRLLATPCNQFLRDALRVLSLRVKNTTTIIFVPSSRTILAGLFTYEFTACRREPCFDCRSSADVSR